MQSVFQNTQQAFEALQTANFVVLRGVYELFVSAF